MIRIEKDAWADMVAHSTAAYPRECCGAMLGSHGSSGKLVTRAIPLENVFSGSQATRYAISPEALLETERTAREQGLSVLGIYHSHPDHDAYFSEEDLKNSCPWYSFLVVSIRKGRFSHANCWLPDMDQSRAEPEALEYPELEEVPWRRS